ncbi:MAG TPA: UDP-N-acetylmuramoyl-L-alanyl-D-glutamate--2,6-diaminopimelate ligase [Longimicrobiales bacterium]|nr:UDP-N-acetylmuramoyl-L-alanyl-D-glutamate--2,6-diaminopimelate ligase [Longimicrobiales bacterium]
MTPPPAHRLEGIIQVLRDAGLLLEVRGSEDAGVSGVSHDSRTTREGDLFVAWHGTIADGHEYVDDAVAAGATAVVCERPMDVDVPCLMVRDGRAAAAHAGQWVQNRPSDELTLAAVTGTNGKTTTALLLRHLLADRARTAVVGTLGFVGPDGIAHPETAALTTPGPVEFARRLRACVDDGVDIVVFEASSHALDQHRFDSVVVDVAVFTNLSRDHLDYHGDMSGYRAAKLRLVEHLGPRGTAVVNVADPAWRDVRGPRTLTFAVDGAPDGGDLHAVDVRTDRTGTDFTLIHRGVRHAARIPLVGAFNVENALAAAGAALALGRSLESVLQRLRTAPQVPGRLERVVDGPVVVLIDFAHTPDALARVLATLRPLVPGRLIVLFGAGGDRDETKRPRMAAAVARLADLVVLTSDNPRTEDPEKILDDLEAGLEGVDFVREADRRAAIRTAIASAEEGDLVLLAGKGHERTQTIGTEKWPFDEAEIARTAWAERGAA